MLEYTITPVGEWGDYCVRRGEQYLIQDVDADTVTWGAGESLSMDQTTYFATLSAAVEALLRAVSQEDA